MHPCEEQNIIYLNVNVAIQTWNGQIVTPVNPIHATQISKDALLRMVASIINASANSDIQIGDQESVGEKCAIYIAVNMGNVSTMVSQGRSCANAILTKGASQ